MSSVLIRHIVTGLDSPVKLIVQLSMQSPPAMSKIPTIFHIANDEDIRQYHESGEYRCASLDSEGFIHCCDKHQLKGVVSRYYSDADNLHLVIINPDKLTGPLIHENTVGGSELFPHVYSVINTDAIISIEPFGLDSTERLNLSE